MVFCFVLLHLFIINKIIKQSNFQYYFNVVTTKEEVELTSFYYLDIMNFHQEMTEYIKCLLLTNYQQRLARFDTFTAVKIIVMFFSSRKFLKSLEFIPGY